MEQKGYISPKSMTTFDTFFGYLAFKENESDALKIIVEDLEFSWDDFQKILEDVPGLLNVMKEYEIEEKDQAIWRKLINRISAAC